MLIYTQFHTATLAHRCTRVHTHTHRCVHVHTHMCTRVCQARWERKACIHLNRERFVEGY